MPKLCSSLDFYLSVMYEVDCEGKKFSLLVDDIADLIEQCVENIQKDKFMLSIYFVEVKGNLNLMRFHTYISWTMYVNVVDEIL